jgi:hypothetical protein
MEKAMSNEYLSLLKRPEWQKKRLEKLELAGWECENCGSKDNQLHVHHRQYFKNRNPWEYDNKQLEVLCDNCHNISHEMSDVIKQILSFSDTNEIFNVLLGYCDPEIISKIDNIPMHQYEYKLRAIGYIAKLLIFVDSRKYRSLAEALIENSFDPVRKEAEDFFRKKYDMELEEM